MIHNNKQVNRVRILNVDVDNLTMKEALREIDRLLRRNRGSYVVTPNVNHIVRLEKDEEFRRAYSEAGLVLTDGKPLVWISRLKGKPVKCKISGSDLFPKVCALADRRNYTVFLFGAGEGVAVKAADKLKNRFEDLRIIGTYSPPMGFEKDENELRESIRIINEAAPDILVLGLSTGKQEQFIYRNRKQINAGITLCLGAAIDFEAGNVRRAPKWMSEHGLEWIYRITREPKRLFMRYFRDGLAMIPIMWKYRGK